MTDASQTIAAILLITVPTIAFGGYSLLMQIVRRIPGYLDNPVRQNMWRAGHAHAGVLVMLALVAMLYVDRTGYSAGLRTLVRSLMVAPPILMPLGFFLSTLKPSVERPNGLIALTFVGGASLAAGTLTLGIGLL